MKTCGCGAVVAAVAAGLAFGAFAEVGVGENILLNPGFESVGEPNPQYWNNEGRDKDTVIPANGMEPGAMPAVKFVGRDGNKGINLRQYGLRLLAGGRYRLSAKVRAVDFVSSTDNGFKIANDRWRWAAGFGFPKGTYDWRLLEQEFTAEPSQGGKYFAVLHIKPFSGTLEVAEAKLVALDEKTRLGTSPSELAAVMTMPRLVPWATFLDEIPAEDPVVSFRYFGKLPKGGIPDYDVKVACGGAGNAVPLADGEIRIRLPQPAAKGTFTASVVRRADGESVFSRTYNHALVAKVADPTPGRKLNNLVTEYFNETLRDGATVERRLTLARGGWTFVSAAAEAVEIDGKAVIGPGTPRHETFRELGRGEHVIRVRGAKGGAFVVRGIPELFNYCTNPSVVKENPPFDWAFVEKYVLPGVTTLNGGKIDPGDVPGLKDRGYIWLGNMNSRNISDDDDICRRLETSGRINAPCYDGVTCDEQYLGQPDVISHYSAGLWKYVHPEGKRVYSWVVGSPAKAGVDHDFIAASVNATGGRGKLLTEYYCVTKASEREAADYVRDWLHGSMAKYDEFSPAYRPRYGVIFGNYTQVPNISIWGHAEVDYRYYLDLQFNLLANDPAFADVGCTGVWGSYYADEEVHRWTFMLMRHYFIEGRRDMLSAQYGFRYISGHLVNGDFAKGLEGWTGTGDVTTGCRKGLGATSEGRRSGEDGCGDTYAVLKRGTGSAATVAQRVKGLVPGKDYCLRYAVLDAKEIAADVRGTPREYALRAVLPEGVAVRRDLSWSHVDERKAVKGSDHAPRANVRHVVFTANAAEMDVVFTVADAQPGEELALNCVSVHPYLPRETAAETAEAEYGKYCRAITGREPPAARFAVDASLDAKHDEYRIVSEGDGVAFLGANRRALLYAVYDFLSRRGGCRWFWDADIVPKKASIDVSGLDVREKSQHEFRGIRHFAHRGLTRFQAEHWGLEDWKREIDWCVKKRLNVMMLRIGQDDVFQRAFPDVCAYPDPAKQLPATGAGYDNRSLFWPLEFRGRLREQVIAYAHARGLMTPEDCGTMTHWYSRTPLDFVRKMKPDYFAEKGAAYNDGKGTGLVWDIRRQRWIDAYWRLTETALRTYDNGDDTLLHAMGVGERKFSEDHEENIRTKLMIDKKVVDEALKRHPDTRVLYPGWDFYYQWRGEDVKRFVSLLDPKRTVIWQYTSDSYKEGKSNPLEWGIVGRFPYTFGIFLAYEAGLDIRTNYDLIRAREAASKDDPFCVGYILWPESSHTDLLAAEYFAANAWRIDDVSTADRIAAFCRDRYGERAAAFEAVWRDVVPVSTNALQETWRSNYGIALLQLLGDSWNNANNDPSRWPARPLGPFAKAPGIFRALAAIDWQGDVVRRDTVDLARTVGDRLTLAAEQNMMDAYFRWKAGDAAAVADFERASAAAQDCAALMRRVLALHTDFSLNDSLARLKAVEPVRNPDFGQVLLENAVNSYCASHQAEPAEHLYPQIIAHVAEEIRARIGTGSREPLDAKGVNALKDAFLKRPLASLKSREARTPGNYRRTMLDFAAAAERMLQTVSGAGDFVPETHDGRGIQKAIDAAAAAGGGRVVLKRATYPSGTLYLKSNVELHLPEGATLLGHDAPDGYDDVDDPRIGKLPENSKKVFIVAMDATNVAITGRGTIDGQGPKFYDRNIPAWRSFYLKPPHPRPRMVEMYRCRDVRFEGVLFKDSPGWTFWIRNCEDVLAKGIRIHGDQRMINNDGLHFDGCKRMRVLGCDFRTGDDSIVFRAIEPPDHDPYDALGEDLYVADCTIDSACQGVRLGCPSDNTIRRAVFTNCVFRGRSAVQSGHPVRYIRKGTGFPKGNCRMEDILFVDCTAEVSGAPIRFFAEDGVALRKYGNVTFRRMTLKGGEPIELTGNPEAVVENVRFEDVTGEIAGKTPVSMSHTRGIAFERFNVSCVPPCPGKVDHRVKVGLYCDKGSRGDNVVRWTRLLDESPDVALTLLEGKDLRSGALAGLDLLVMPGGSGFDQYKSMGEEGARAIRDYVRGGGRYLGTCAGLALLLNETNRVALLPLRRIDGHFRRGGGDLGVEFNEAGMKALGITNRIWAVRYHNGPIVVPAAAIEGTACETLATCRNGIHEQGVSPKRDDMVGTPAFVRATCGKGEVIACNCHPEAYPATRELAVAMIRALTGREIHPPAKYFRSYRAFGKGALKEAVRDNE